MVLPNFICVSAEKAGTTPLFRILVQHRDIFMPRNKETHYFTQLWNWKPLAFYEAHFFKGCAEERAVGEATPEYMRFPEVPARLSETLGRDLKLIFCLRDPVKRAFSQYHLRCRLMEETESFEAAIALEAERAAANPYLGRRQAYLGGSRYLEQIERFLPHFPRENMFFVILEEDLKKNRAATVSRIFDFLEVGPDPKVRLDLIDSGDTAPRIRFSSEARPLYNRTKTNRRRLPREPSPSKPATAGPFRSSNGRHPTRWTTSSAWPGISRSSWARNWPASSIATNSRTKSTAWRYSSAAISLAGDATDPAISPAYGLRAPPRCPTDSRGGCGRGC
jgi:hypothetical protein